MNVLTPLLIFGISLAIIYHIGGDWKWLLFIPGYLLLAMLFSPMAALALVIVAIVVLVVIDYS